MLSQNDISLLLRLIVAYYIVDFLFCSVAWRRHWSERKWNSIWLYIHGLIAGVIIYVSSTLWGVIWFPIVMIFSHILIDGVEFKPDDLGWSLLLEQLLHLVIIIICWIFLVYFNLSNEVKFIIPAQYCLKFWILTVSYVILFQPCGTLIGKITEQWRNQIEDDSLEGLAKAGLWIGRLERVLILTFVLLNRYEAIGFLIAAKSIFRFGEITRPEHRKVAEYILIGTLISVVIAIFVGVLTGWILENLLGNS